MNSLQSNSIRLCFAVGLLFCSITFAVQVRVAEAPTSDLNLTIAAIKSAKRSVLLNAYDFSSTEIQDAVLDRIDAGVQVSILQEGQAVGGMSSGDKKVEATLISEMQKYGNDHYFLMSSTKANNRRYRFDHAKYVVIDGQSLLIGSENYTPTGSPSPGAVGNRGWQTYLENTDLASDFTQIFAEDTSTKYGDVTEMTGRTGVGYEGMFQGVSALAMPSHRTSAPPVNLSSFPEYQASDVVRITSPDSSLSGLTAMLNGAESSIDLELMTFTSSWNATQKVSPLYSAVVAAARRGVKVRVLLNDNKAFDHPSGAGGNHGSTAVVQTSTDKNIETISALNAVARSENLPLEALTANIKGMGVDYIHNKGALIDGDKTLISSINWDENSVVNNREAAVLITSPGVNGHYGALFESDWNVSTH